MALQKLSRRKLAVYCANQIIAGNQDGVIKHLAHYLVSSRRTRESLLIVRDIETILLAKGIVVADITTAGSLTDSSEKSITKYLKDYYGGDKIVLRKNSKPDVIGGAKISTADSEYDGTVVRKLRQLQAIKI